MDMWRGSTPTLAFRFPFKTEDINALTLKCNQLGTTKISKALSDFEESGEYVLYTLLTQADTLALTGSDYVTMQFKVQFDNNHVVPSSFMKMAVNDVFDTVVMSGTAELEAPTFAIDVPFPEVDGSFNVVMGMAVSSGGAVSVAWTDITGKPETFPPSSHTHDDRYYTESEVNTLLSGKQDTLTAGQNITIVDNVISASGGGGSSDFDTLTNRPKYNGSTMTHSTNIPEVKTATWDAKADTSDIPTKTSDLTNDSGFLTSHQDISGKQNIPAQVTSGTNITLEDNTEYRLTNVSTLTLAYPSGNFDCWLHIETASSGTITITIPTSTYIGTVPTFANSEVWELSIKDGVVVAGKAVNP